MTNQEVPVDWSDGWDSNPEGSLPGVYFDFLYDSQRLDGQSLACNLGYVVSEHNPAPDLSLEGASDIFHALLNTSADRLGLNERAAIVDFASRLVDKFGVVKESGVGE